MKIFITSIRDAGVCGEFPSSTRWVAGALAKWKVGAFLAELCLKNPQLGGVPGPANYCIAIYGYIYIYIYWYWAVVYKFDCRTSYQIEDGTALDQAFYSPVLNFRHTHTHTRTPTRTSWMITVCLKLFDVICTLYLNITFKVLMVCQWTLPSSCLKGLPNLSQHGRLVSQSPTSESCTAKLLRAFLPRNGENHQIVVNSKGIPKNLWILGFFGNLPMMNLEAFLVCQNSDSFKLHWL